MTSPRRPQPPPTPRDLELEVELDLEPLDVELDFDDGAIERKSSVEISYDELDLHSAHAAFADAREVARRATSRRRAPKAPALVGHGRDVRLRRAELLRALAENARGSHRARLLASAAELFESVGDPRAARMLENAIAEDPPDPVALRARRRLASKAGRLDEVIALLRRETDLPLAPIEEALTRAVLSDRLEAAGDAAALTEAKRAHDACPSSPAASLAWVNAAARAGDPAEAIQALVAATRAVDSPPLRGLLALELAHRAERAERAEAALAWAEAALGHSPDLLAAHLVAIRAARKLGDRDAVRAHVVALSSRLPDGPARSALLRWTARWARANGESSDAIARILKLPTSAPDFRLLAELALASGDLDAARRHLMRAAELSANAQRAAALRDLTLVELRAGNRDSALARAREASRADPGSPLEARLRAFLGDDRSADDPLARAARAAIEGSVEPELAALLAARDAGEAPYASELVSTDLSGLQDGGGTFVESVALELARRPKSERAGLALATALLRAGEGDVKGALEVLASSPDDPLAERLAAELRGAPLPGAASAEGEPEHEMITRLVELSLDSPDRLASGLSSRLEAFRQDPHALGLARRVADTPSIHDARRAALSHEASPGVLVAEAALLALGRGERGEKNPFARALRERGFGGPAEALLAARVAELSHAPVEAARIRAELAHLPGAALIGARLALQGEETTLALSLASSALSLAPRGVAAARALEVAAMEAYSLDDLVRAEDALIEALAPADDGVSATALLQFAGRRSAEAIPALQRAARRYAHVLDVTRRAEGAIRSMDDGAAAAELLEGVARGYATVLERASALVRAADVAEAAGDVPSALRLLGCAASEEPSHPVAASELARLKRAQGDVAGAIEALAIAANASKVTTRSAALLHEAALLAEGELHDEPRALELYARAIELDPGRGESAARASALLRARGEAVPEAWLDPRGDAVAPAGDAALRRAERLLDAGQRDLAREALEALLTADPGHAGALRALTSLELDESRPEQAMLNAKALLEAAATDRDRLFAHVTMAELSDQHRGDLSASAAHYGMAIDLAPHDAVLRGRLAAAKARLGDASAGEALRDAIEALRRAIERRPDRAEGWTALVETLTACGLASPAATVGAVASALGALDRPEAAHELAALDPTWVDRLAPRALSPAARVLFVAGAPIFEGLAPFRPDRWEATPLDPSHPTSRALAELAPEGGLRVYVSARVARACAPADGEGRAVVLGRELVERFPAEQLRFLAATSQALSVAGLAPMVQLNRGDLEKCLGAVFAALEIEVPGFEAYREGPFVDAARRLLPSERDALSAAASELAADESFDPGALVDAALRYGHRAALARIGDGTAAIEALIGLHGGVEAGSGRERVEAIRAVPAAWDLVLFSVSPACIAARRKVER